LHDLHDFGLRADDGHIHDDDCDNECQLLADDHQYFAGVRDEQRAVHVHLYAYRDQE
jgi:hypothetical protein